MSLAEQEFSLGLKEHVKGNPKGAIKHYDKAIKLRPDYSNAYLNRGAAKSDLGLQEEAIADYERAIKLRPDFAEAYNNKSELQICMGDNDGAEITLIYSVGQFKNPAAKAIGIYLLQLALVAQGKDDGVQKTDFGLFLGDNPAFSIGGVWGFGPIEKKLAELEKDDKFPKDRLEKMKAIHAEFKKLDR